MTVVARDVADVSEALRSRVAVVPRGGGSKSGLSNPTGDGEVLDVSALRGVVEHLPQEFTLTVRAATTVSEAAELLSGAGQYLPFDPMLAEAGATLGGTVAAGFSGPGRVRYGGVRDFILGVALVDGEGREVRGGGKVVKNAAGFDLPKLMVGSLGTLGVLTEITFKVFPAPEARATLRVATENVADAVEVLLQLLRSPIDFDAIDLDEEGTLWARIAGRRDALPQRVARLRELLPEADEVADRAAAAFWQEAGELSWIRPDETAVWVPVTPRRMAAVAARLPATSRRRFSGAGQSLWIAWPAEVDALAELNRILADLDMAGLRVRGGGGPRWLGTRGPEQVRERVRRAMDPFDRLAGAR